MPNEEHRNQMRELLKDLDLSEHEWQIASLMFGLDDGIARDHDEIMREMYFDGIRTQEITELSRRVGRVLRPPPEGE
jgi:hypothetical protein